jgi:23S rRNA-/tRNA-specific pseudouridylate synthase
MISLSLFRLLIIGISVQIAAFVSSSTHRRPHHYHQKRFRSKTPVVSHQTLGAPGFQYEILEKIEVAQDILLPKLLLETCPNRFPSVSQAKRACTFGKILLVAQSSPDHTSPNYTLLNETVMKDCSFIVGSPSSVVSPSEEVWVCTRLSDPFKYPEQATRYMSPPLGTENVEVVFETDDFAVVNKPENLTTIGEDRHDLQSMLGFVLRPPSMLRSDESPYLPRPVHRLDRRTSGLVLVAKSKESMKFFSRQFSDRNVGKRYMAVVFGLDKLPGNSPSSDTLSTWNTIDYPIDGKESISHWRIIRTSQDGAFALVEVKPHTGRFHQIRRHLSYCLSLPIVGDSKYDNGIRTFRTNGMYLCCHSLDFPITTRRDSLLSDLVKGNGTASVYTDADSGESRVHIRIPLPSKFLDRLDLQ